MLAALADSANGNVKVIAEVKRRSPSKGWLHESLDVAQTARLYADGGATAISVLTDASTSPVPSRISTRCDAP